MSGMCWAKAWDAYIMFPCSGGLVAIDYYCRLDYDGECVGDHRDIYSCEAHSEGCK